MTKEYAEDKKLDREVKEVLWKLAEGKISNYRSLRGEVYDSPKKSIFSESGKNIDGKKYSPPPPEYKGKNKFIFK